MKKLTILLGLSILALPACRKAQTNTNTQTTEDPSKIAEELRALELEEKRLKHEIEIERLALEKDSIARQRQELNEQNEQLQEMIIALEKERTRLAEDRNRTAEENARMAEIERKLAEEKARLAQVKQRPTNNQEIPGNPKSVSALQTEYDFSVFHNRLSPHGTWFSVPQYGYVWRPNCWNQNDWHPYTLGHWVYSDCGWTWVSSEPFGWATYHYGRWVLLKNTGWCWVPGTTWGPAWVCWRNDTSHIGWAPLPPESLHWRGNDWTTYYGDSCGLTVNSYCFVRTSHFGSNISSFVFSRSDCNRIYSSTNYCGGYRFENQRAICRAIDYDIACRWIGQTIPRYQCELNTTLPNGLDPLRHVARRGDRIQFHAPDFQAPWNTALRPNRVESEIRDDLAIRSKAFNPEIQARFFSRREEERVVAAKTINDETSQKVMRRIGLREKIVNQRENLVTSIAQPAIGLKEPSATVTQEQIVPTMEQGMKHTQETRKSRESTMQIPDVALQQEGTKPDQHVPNAPEQDRSQTGEIADASTMRSGQLDNANRDSISQNQEQPRGGGLREIQGRERNPGSVIGGSQGQHNQQGPIRPSADELLADLQEKQQKALRQQQARERELGEAERRRAMEEAEKRQMSDKAAQEQMRKSQELAEAEAEQQQKEQAERMRAEQEAAITQKEQAERMRAEQEAAIAQKEQAERMRAEQEAAIAQKEQAERMRAEQEAARERQEQAERMRAEQEAVRERQEQAERMRAEQEASRERQEQAERMRAEQEAARERQDQADRMRAEQEAARERQEQAERMRQQSGQ